MAIATSYGYAFHGQLGAATYLRLEGMELGDAEIVELAAEARAGSAAKLKVSESVSQSLPHS